MTRRLTMALGLVMALSIIVVPIAGAHDKDHQGRGWDDGDQGPGMVKPTLPARIDLPDGFAPEGITSGFRNTFYVGSVVNGAIWRGGAKSSDSKILVAGVAGRMAAGLHLDRRGRLWVAGADNHTIRVYNALTGELLQTYTFPTAGFINDLAITRDAVYATDSNNRQLAVVPLAKGKELPDPSAAKLLPLTGDYVIGAGFNANGIVSKHGWVIIVQSNTGKLFRVDPKTGETKTINTGSYSVLNGDGLVLGKGNLYVVRNQNNLVAVLKLGDDLLSASLVGEITSPGNLDFPTTATFAHGKLWAVNARFEITPTATTKYWITQLSTKP